MDEILIAHPGNEEMTSWSMRLNFEQFVERMGSHLAEDIWDYVNQHGSYTSENGCTYTAIQY